MESQTSHLWDMHSLIQYFKHSNWIYVIKKLVKEFAQVANQ